MDSVGLLEARKRALAKEQASRYCPHDPFPNQRAFLALDCLEALYGGAAGGGKSDALLMAALQYVHVPGYAALLFRRTHTDLALPDAIMARAREWLGPTDARWIDDIKTYQFPSGATLTFGYLDTEQHKYRYQSTAFQFVGFDEMTQFPEPWVTYLFSRMRRPKGLKGDHPLMKVPLRLRGATNPGGLGHKWVKRRYVDPETALGPFIPSKLDDNPHLDHVSYLESLARLDPTTRAQLRDGVWVQDTGGLVYSQFDRKRNVVPMPDRSGAWRYILSMDFGFDDDCAFGILGWPRHERRVVVVTSEKHKGLIPSAAAARAQELERQFKPDRVVGDTGGLGKGYAEEMRQRFSVAIEAAEKHNKIGYIKLMNGAMAGDKPELVIAAGANDELVTELEELPWYDERHEKEAPGFANHLTDMMLYGWRAASAWNEKDAPGPATVFGTPQWYAEQAAKEKEKAIRESMGGGKERPWFAR